MGCKRIVLSDDLWCAFNRDNVDIESNGIERIEPDGIRTSDGSLHEVDVIVYATGFDIEGHLRSMNVYGLNKRSLLEEWAETREAYYGCCVEGFPNYYSGYISESGKITPLYPKNARAFKRQLARVRFDDFDLIAPSRFDRAA